MTNNNNDEHRQTMVAGEKERLATAMVRQRGSPVPWRRAAATTNPRDDKPAADEGGPLRAAGGAGRAVQVAGHYSSEGDFSLHPKLTTTEVL